MRAQPAQPTRPSPVPAAGDADALPRFAWAILGVAFVASVAAVIAQFAAPPLLPLLMADFGIDVAAASSLISVFSVTGVVLALPAGLILARTGPVLTGAAAMVAVVVGSVMGALAPSYEILLAGRLVQGVAVGLVGVVAPAVVAMTFPPARRGVPMGIWAMWVPVGGVIMFNLAPALGAAGGWPLAWWFSGAVGAVALVLWVVVLRLGLPGAGGGAGSGAHAGGPSMREALAGRQVWLLALLFSLFALSVGGVNSFLPTFLVEQRGMSLGAASGITSLFLVGSSVGSVAGGVLSDRIGSRRRVYVAAALVSTPMLAIPFSVDPALLPVVLPATGLVSAMIPSTVFASVPEVMPDPRAAGAGMAAVMLGQNGAFVLGPILFAALVGGLGWVGTAVVFAAFSVACAGVGVLTRVR